MSNKASVGFKLCAQIDVVKQQAIPIMEIIFNKGITFLAVKINGVNLRIKNANKMVDLYFNYVNGEVGLLNGEKQV
ncbi:hypothetical protein AQF98_21255 [Pedobacter sp. Hv1]|nr:hypothetical protein AQF98_21255 [Pedobacter sp. Hv1]